MSDYKWGILAKKVGASLPRRWVHWYPLVLGRSISVRAMEHDNPEEKARKVLEEAAHTMGKANLEAEKAVAVDWKTEPKAKGEATAATKARAESDTQKVISRLKQM